MSGFYAPDAMVVSPPGTGGTLTIPSGASSTAAACKLTAHKGHWLWIKSTVKAHIRFSSAGTAATTGNIYLTPDVDYPFRIPANTAARDRITAYGVSAGTLYFRRTSGEY